ncbi:hypothetical protein V8G54_026863 [Vigna mungo]|uniref:Uncharacterized protein n=1 Tax=Vigna mungo TaxID=3915 RepID=A0AAQ3N0U2_VIGMU
MVPSEHVCHNTKCNICKRFFFSSSCMFLWAFFSKSGISCVKNNWFLHKIRTKTEAQLVCLMIDTASRLPTICIVTDHIKKKITRTSNKHAGAYIIALPVVKRKTTSAVVSFPELVVLIKSTQEELRCLYPECMASPWPPTSHSTCPDAI